MPGPFFVLRTHYFRETVNTFALQTVLGSEGPTCWSANRKTHTR